MIDVMFVCSAGMSTSLLVERVKKEAEAAGIEMHIYALGESEAKKNLEKPQVILLGPQVRYMEKAYKKLLDGTDKKLGVIDMLAYGRLDGAKVYKQIADLLGL